LNQVYIGLLGFRKLRIKWYGTTSHPKLILTTFFQVFGYFDSSVFHRSTTDTNIFYFAELGDQHLDL
jgi:hypothetical protein